MTSNRGFAEWGDLFGDPAVASALPDRLVHHAVPVRIERASCRLRAHADRIPGHVRANAPITPPPSPKRRRQPPKLKNGAADHRNRLIAGPAKWGTLTRSGLPGWHFVPRVNPAPATKINKGLVL
ncbi:ATP-binding protein [Mangrovicoccus ximenensis]|uniref:ATP-binding protein n=1 Tax=Mangrovicoccus ximenensis TaxID=1911570 RepID=UPI000D34E311